MNFIKTTIENLIVIEPKVFNDERGFFYESYQKRIFEENGILDNFVQDNVSHSSKGVLRGLHFQRPPHAQSKLVRVVRGSVYDVAVDIRQGSKTFGQHYGLVLSAENKKMLFIPKGFAHGFCVLEDETEFAYKCSDFYSPKDETGILWSDLNLAIKWPKLDVPFILSDKDKKYPPLNEAI